MVRIFHNPKCSKSREALNLLEQKGELVTVIEYLKTPPALDELRELVELLGIRPHELIRKEEPEYRENFKGKELSDDEWLEAMVRFPKLIQRPIVIRDNKAVIGRPPERVLSLL